MVVENMSNTAFVIEIEGLDCVGKETQSKLLKKYLESEGNRVKLISYPNYENKYSQEVSHYLKGEFDKDRLTPERISLFYTMDRLTTQLYSLKKEELYDGYDYIILDRGIFSNILNQGVNFLGNEYTDKITGFVRNEELERFFNKQLSLEDDLDIIKPDVILILDLKNEIREKLLTDRNKDKKVVDIVESNFEYMRNIQKIIDLCSKGLFDYDTMENNYSNINPFIQVIKCYEGNNILSIDRIHGLIKEKMGDVEIW